MKNLPAYSVAALMLLSAQAQAMTANDIEAHSTFEKKIANIAPMSDCTTVNFSDSTPQNDRQGSN